ncbi:tetratricopeptide repeat protein [Algiphilus sp.]|uniref:tetratricopeptide repeat protein n=1 Tax=Algiphilus sp. TaxID=1872431 RepID=UPI0032ED7869
MTRLPVVSVAAAILLTACQAIAPEGRERPSVGTMIGASSSLGAGEGWLVVDRADLVSPERTAPAAGSIAVSLDHYASLLALPGAPAELRAEALRRAAYLRIRQAAEGGLQDPSPLRAALDHYRQLFAEFPGASGNDSARYQMARAYEMLGQRVEAADTLARLLDDHPASVLYVDAAFRAGELYYQERALTEAAEAYKRVLARGSEAEALHALAAYKLGWTQFMEGRPSEAATVFIDLLGELLPSPEDDCALDCLRQLAKGKGITTHVELGRDAIRGLTLALMAQGGIDALARRSLDDTRAPVYYWALAAALLERQRFHDAAATYAAFAARYPEHRWAPVFGERVIASYDAGGFEAAAMTARAQFVETFDTGAAYWEGAAPTEAVKGALRTHLDTLASHHHARAQALSASDPPASRAAAHASTRWYRSWLALLPEGSERNLVRMRLADALLESDALAKAADEYRALAYGTPGFAQSDDAALAEVQTRYRIAERAQGEAATGVTLDAIAASRRFAAREPAHAQRSRVLLRAAEESFDLRQFDAAIELAGDALRPMPSDPALVSDAHVLMADSHLASRRFAEAESLYDIALANPAASRFDSVAVMERFATAIYRQGEAARADGERARAADAFLRVGEKAPDTALAASAHFDAGAVMVEAQDWRRASEIFAGFRARYASHALVPDAEKWLATAYEKNAQPRAAAKVYERIAQRGGEPSTVRRAAQWKAAQLYDESNAPSDAYRAYQDYVAAYPAQTDSAQEARLRLAEIASDHPRLPGNALRWWQAIVAAHGASEAKTTPFSELAAARAHLQLGRQLAARAERIQLRQPLAVHLRERQRLMQEAIAHFRHVDASGFDDLVTPASYAIGATYQDLAAGLQRSERPPALRSFEKDAYELLLEDEIYPVEELAIEAHRRNLDYLSEGLWDQWVLQSARALSDLVPARYARQERQENIYAQFD